MERKKFRVTLPIDVGGRVHEFGEVVELDMETALEYSHALIAVEEGPSPQRHGDTETEEERDGGNG